MINLQEEILKLSVAERILMIEKIWDSIDREKLDIPPSHKAELDRRLEKHRSGESRFFSWEEVKKDIRSALRDDSAGSF